MLEQLSDYQNNYEDLIGIFETNLFQSEQIYSNQNKSIPIRTNPFQSEQIQTEQLLYHDICSDTKDKVHILEEKINQLEEKINQLEQLIISSKPITALHRIDGNRIQFIDNFNNESGFFRLTCANDDDDFCHLDLYTVKYTDIDKLEYYLTNIYNLEYINVNFSTNNTSYKTIQVKKLCDFVIKFVKIIKVDEFYINIDMHPKMFDDFCLLDYMLSIITHDNISKVNITNKLCVETDIKIKKYLRSENYSIIDKITLNNKKWQD
jgi:hypothetical protein